MRYEDGNDNEYGYGNPGWKIRSNVAFVDFVSAFLFDLRNGGRWW